MSELLQITADIDNVLKRLETLLRSSQSRASSHEVQELVGYARRIFEYFHDVVVNKREEVQVENSNDYVELAVKLHNKVRNLNAPILSIAKNLLRASAAWMFILFGEKTSKILSIIIKLLSKSGEELCRQEDTKALGLDCFNACIVLWKSSGDVPIYDQLPALELQDTKFCVFKSLQGVIMNSNVTKMHANDIKQVASFGVDIAESLDDRFQLSLVDTLFKIGHQFADCQEDTHKNRKVDAIHFLNLAVSILRKPAFQNMLHTDVDVDTSASDGKSSLIRTYLDLRVRVYLALVYIYTDINEVNKATACIDAIEEVEKLQQRHLLESLMNTITFSKLLVAAQQGDLDKSETAVKQLLRNTHTPFNTAMAAVKKLQLLMKEGDRDRMSEYYKQLAGKYSSDPEFTSIRIAYLQVTVGNLKATKDDEHHESRARDISTRIVSDHLHQLHVLRSEEFLLFRNILCDQINWYKSLNLWSYVKSWCDILLSLVDDIPEEQDKVSVAFAIKVEALMQMHQNAEAVDTAQRFATKEISLRSLTTLFKALLCSDDLSVDGILGRLFAFHQKKQTSTTLNLMTTEERLQNLMMCAFIAQHPSQSNKSAFYQALHGGKRYELVVRLLQQWMNLFSTEQYWRHSQNSDVDRGTGFLDVMTEYLSRVSLHLADEMLSKFSSIGCINSAETTRLGQALQALRQQMVPSMSAEAINAHANPEGIEVSSVDEKAMDVEIKVEQPLNSPKPPENVDCFQILRDLSIIQPAMSMSLILQFLSNDILPYIELLIRNMSVIKDELSACGLSIETLGDKSLCVNTADICYKFCQLLLDIRDASTQGIVNNSNASTLAAGTVNNHRVESGGNSKRFHEQDLLLWSKLADYSESLYNLVDPALKRQRILSLVLSAVAFIEAFDFNANLLSENSGDSSGEDLVATIFASASTEVSAQKQISTSSAGEEQDRIKSLIPQAIDRLYRAALMQRDFMDFGNKEDEHLRSLIFMLLVAAFSRGGTVTESEQFVTTNAGEISVLSVENMRQYIDQVSQSRKFSVEAVRKSMEICVEALSCRAVPDSLMIWLYRKLIELSPSRKYACSKLEEIQSILADGSVNNFDTEDIDNIIARAYNSCLMLIDLDQLSLAEQFVEHSLALSQFASEDAKQYLPRMQETLEFIKQQQSFNHHGAVKLPAAIVGTNVLNEEASIHATPEQGKVGHLNAELFTKPTE